MTHFLHTEADLQAGLAQLVLADPRLVPVAEKAGAFSLRRREAGFPGLCAIVCGQQLSTAAARDNPRPVVCRLRSVSSRRRTRARAPTSSNGSACRPPRSSRSRKSARPSPKGHIDLDAVGNMDADAGARNADRAAWRRTVDRRHLSAVLSRPCRCVSVRRSRGCRKSARIAFGPAQAAGREGAHQNGRGLAAVARRGGASALGLLSRGEAARRHRRRVQAKIAGRKKGRQENDEKEKEEWLNSTARGSSRARDTARQLVVFLHGYGADGNDLIDIGRAWQRTAAATRLSSRRTRRGPAARRRRAANGFRSPSAIPTNAGTGVNAAAPVLNAFLDAELKRRNLPPSALALVGFSAKAP